MSQITVSSTYEWVVNMSKWIHTMSSTYESNYQYMYTMSILLMGSTYESNWLSNTWVTLIQVMSSTYESN